MYLKKTSFFLSRFFFALLLLTGCGEESLFEGLADDNSPQARLEQAQEALDKSDCTTAIRLFTELQAEDPNNVARRLDLSASYLCAAGLSVQGVLKVAADFTKTGSSTATSSSEVTETNLFSSLTKQAAALIPNTTIWQSNVCKSKELLGEVKRDPNKNVIGDVTWPCTTDTATSTAGTSTPIFFNNDKDAGYILSIVNLVDATLTVADALNTINGASQCVQSATSTQTLSTCQLTTEDLLSVANSLLAAQQSATAATGSGGQLFQPVDNIIFSADTSNNGTLEQGEVLNYLLGQKLITDPNAVSTPGCTFTQNPPQYTCS